jgi:hypothetical protein
MEEELVSSDLVLKRILWSVFVMVSVFVLMSISNRFNTEEYDIWFWRLAALTSILGFVKEVSLRKVLEVNFLYDLSVIVFSGYYFYYLFRLLL